MTQANDRISVSEDRLRAVLAEFELRFLERLDSKLERKADLVMLNEARRRIADNEQEIETLNQWRSRLTSRFFGGDTLANVNRRVNHALDASASG